MNLTINQWPKLNSNQLKNLALMIQQSAEQFYELLPINNDKKIDFIINSINDKESDLNDCVSAFENENLVGALSFYNSSELQGRFLYYMRKFSDRDFHQNLIKYFKTIPSIPSSGSYLSRIAIMSNLKGSGIGTDVLNVFEIESKKQGFSRAYLHVHIDNNRAINFYKKNNWKIEDDHFKENLHQYHLMSKLL